MLFSDNDILMAMHDGRIGIDPFDKEMLQPASIDVRLGSQFVHDPMSFSTWGAEVIDPQRDNSHHTVSTVVPEDGDFVLAAGEFALGHTVEVISLSPKIAAWLEGRSSLARLGLIIHSTAGFIDPGFSGQITLELGNVARRSIRLRPGMRVGQVTFMPLLSPPSVPYGPLRGSKYHGQTGATSSRSHEDRD